MAGGAGVEYYFGYLLPENDLACEDFRSRHLSWQFCRIALKVYFFVKASRIGNGSIKADRFTICPTSN
jgi:hypothetical protein